MILSYSQGRCRVYMGKFSVLRKLPPTIRLNPIELCVFIHEMGIITLICDFAWIQREPEED